MLLQVPSTEVAFGAEDALPRFLRVTKPERPGRAMEILSVEILSFAVKSMSPAKFAQCENDP